MGEEVEIERICQTLDELESISILSQATEVGGGGSAEPPVQPRNG